MLQQINRINSKSTTSVKQYFLQNDLNASHWPRRDIITGATIISNVIKKGKVFFGIFLKVNNVQVKYFTYQKYSDTDSEENKICCLFV